MYPNSKNAFRVVLFGFKIHLYDAVYADVASLLFGVVMKQPSEHQPLYMEMQDNERTDAIC